MKPRKKDGKPWNDEELYETMAVPYETKEEGIAAMQRFVEGIELLREECRVPEVLIAMSVYCKQKDAEGKELASPGCPINMLSLGNAEVAVELGALVFQHYTAPTLKRAKRLQETAHAEVNDDHKVE